MVQQFAWSAETTVLTYPVVLEPMERTFLVSDVKTKVRKIHKHMGDAFEKGELLIEFDDVAIKASYQKALAQQEKAKSIYHSKKVLFEKGLISPTELLEAKTAKLITDADQKIAFDELQKTVIRAPYDGRVVHVNVREEEYPNYDYHMKDRAMLEIVSDRELNAKLLVPVRIARLLSPGNTLTVTLRETSQEVQAKVQRIGVLVDPTSATVPIEAWVDNEDGSLMGGMMGSAVINPEPEEDA